MTQATAYIEPTKIRMSKKFIKQLGDIGPRIAEIADHFRVKTVHYKVVPEGHRQATLRNSEGQRNYVFYAGQERAVETVSEHTYGAAGLNHDILGEYPMPAGATFVEVSYLGGYFMYVTNVSEKALEPAPAS